MSINSNTQKNKEKWPEVFVLREQLISTGIAKIA